MRPTSVPLVRPHSECLTGDVFGSQRCDCGPQLREAVERIADAGGYLLYLRQEGRGIGLYAKLDAYALQDAGLDTYEANLALGHARGRARLHVAAQMLRALGVRRGRAAEQQPRQGRPARAGSASASAARVPTAVPTSRRRTRGATCPPRRGTATPGWARSPPTSTTSPLVASSTPTDRSGSRRGVTGCGGSR